MKDKLEYFVDLLISVQIAVTVVVFVGYLVFGEPPLVPFLLVMSSIIWISGFIIVGLLEVIERIGDSE